MPYLVRVIGEVGDGEGLHEGRGVGEGEHHKDLGRQLRAGAPWLGHVSRFPNEHIGQGVVERKVRVRHEVEGDGHLGREGL